MVTPFLDRGWFPLVLEPGYGQAGVVAAVAVYRVFPGAVAEVKQVVPVALVLLLPHGDEVVGKYPHLGATASPEDYHAGEVVRVVP
jgi:hypothetical protein